MVHLYRVRATSQGWTGGPGLGTFYFRNAVDTSDDGADVAASCVLRVRTGYFDSKSLYPPAWTCLVSGLVDVIDETNGDLVDSFATTDAALVTGTFGAGFGPVPTMLALTLRTNTILDAHKVRGRSFLGPLSNNTDPDGSPTAALVTTGQAMGTALLDAGVGGPLLVVWHRPITARPDATPPVVGRDGGHGDVTSTSVRDRYAILRSRRD